MARALEQKMKDDARSEALAAKLRREEEAMRKDIERQRKLEEEMSEKLIYKLTHGVSPPALTYPFFFPPFLFIFAFIFKDPMEVNLTEQEADWKGSRFFGDTNALEAFLKVQKLPSFFSNIYRNYIFAIVGSTWQCDYQENYEGGSCTGISKEFSS